jgi:hypothetical protein
MKSILDMTPDEAAAEAERREQLRARGLPFHSSFAPPRSPAEQDADDDRLEKVIVAAADKRMRALGFVVWNLSQPRASKIAAGIPDRLYTSPSRGLALYWEAKSASGRQRPDQRVFQEHCEACGLHYVLGTDQALSDWLAVRGIHLSEG